jgi:hypothetical protein
MLKIFVGVFVAIFAVIGFYDTVRCLAERVLASDGVVLSILVRSREDVECLEANVIDHISGALTWRSQRLLILISEELADDPRPSELARKYGAELYLIRRTD